MSEARDVNVLPPLKEWARKTQKSGGKYAEHVALKRSGRGWTGFADAVAKETAPTDRDWWPGGYVSVPIGALPRILARLGDNAHRVTVRAVVA